jgi:RimJ/RimL family protein N-acetyltransferase
MIVLETKRMLLRKMNPDDVDNLQGIFSDPEAMRFYRSTKDISETIEWISEQMMSYRAWRFGMWAAVLKESQQFCGQCGLVMQRVDGLPEVEVGYLFLRKYWGQGLATEAALASRDYATGKLGYPRVISLIDPNNKASIRVAEKIGMAFEKKVYKFDRHLHVYAYRDPTKPPDYI